MKNVPGNAWLMILLVISLCLNEAASSVKEAMREKDKISLGLGTHCRYGGKHPIFQGPLFLT